MNDLVYTILAALLWVAVTLGALLYVAHQLGAPQ